MGQDMLGASHAIRGNLVGCIPTQPGFVGNLQKRSCGQPGNMRTRARAQAPTLGGGGPLEGAGPPVAKARARPFQGWMAWWVLQGLDERGVAHMVCDRLPVAGTHKGNLLREGVWGVEGRRRRQARGAEGPLPVHCRCPGIAEGIRPVQWVEGWAAAAKYAGRNGECRLGWRGRPRRRRRVARRVSCSVPASALCIDAPVGVCSLWRHAVCAVGVDIMLLNARLIRTGRPNLGWHDAEVRRLAQCTGVAGRSTRCMWMCVPSPARSEVVQGRVVVAGRCVCSASVKDGTPGWRSVLHAHASGIGYSSWRARTGG